MEDPALLSMCIDPGSYCTFAEQKRAFTQCNGPQRTIFRNRNTYVHMVVPVLRHWVAVQVTISPFILEKFPGQTFFSSAFRYGPCCYEINHAGTSNIVRETVQKVIDSNYRPVCWNYSSNQCYTLDHPTNTDIEQCILVAKSRFQTYAGSTRAGPTSLARDHTSTSESHTQNRGLYLSSINNRSTPHDTNYQSRQLLSIEKHSASTETLFPRSHPSDINNRNAPDGTSCLQPSIASLKRKAETIPDRELAPPSSKQRISEGKDEKRVRTIAAWLKEGIEKLPTESFPNPFTFHDIMSPQAKDEAYTCADWLWKWALDAENASKPVLWYVRYLAGCSLLVATRFASSSKPGMELQSVESSLQSIHNWRGFAEIVNSIIHEMQLSWGVKAYVLYHIFAAKGEILSSVARLSEKRRKGIASGIADALKLTPPSRRFDGVLLFNPARILSSLLRTRSYEEICSAIGLSSVVTSGTIEDRGSSPAIPAMLTLCIRVNELNHAFSAQPAKANSGVNIPSTPSSPTPLTTPATFQQIYSIDTGVTTEWCHKDDANQHQRGVNFHQSLCITPAEADYSRNVLPATHNAENSTTPTSAQAGDCRPSLPAAGGMTLVEVADTGLSGSTAASGQDKEGVSGSAQRVTTGQELRMGISRNKGNPMLSNLSATDWDNCDIEVFQPLRLRFRPDSVPFQPEHLQLDGDSDNLFPESFEFDIED